MAKKVVPISEIPVFDRISSDSFLTEHFTSGAVILMDKPLEWSSFQVVKFVRNRIPPKKVGHAGTLDPLATGLLVICSGKATKSISQIQEMPKTYVADIRFGASTPSFDAATEPDGHAGWKHLDPETVMDTLENKFSGVISQIPPMYSAVSVQGERLYKKARRGETVERKKREVTVHNIEIVASNLPDLTLKIECSKGTYIRSIAHDLGLALGSRAYLTGLRRTHIGHFDVESAVTTDNLELYLKQTEENG